MQYSIGDVLLDDDGEFDLELEVNGIDDKDCRCDLISQLISPAIQTVVEYVKTMPANYNYERDEDGCLMIEDLNDYLAEFKTKHLDKFASLLKENIQGIELSAG